MGDYTELHYNVELVEDIPADVMDVLRSMVDGEGFAEQLPDHEFFGSLRWRYLFTMDSYYFAAKTHSEVFFDDITHHWFLNIRSNIKNYNEEIEKFIDWIDPYVDAFKGEFLGFYRFETKENPTLVRKR